ncbi:MAG: hypothetical protein NTV07_01180 [Candidatus Omnitrophica bacterium]|nr:hypothetical protein [Candidatus Omnitrophota bacterium]
MNTKQLISIVVIISTLILSFPAISICADYEISGIPDPRQKASLYSYDDTPEVWFFPVDQARWDGNNINNWTWLQLNDEQRAKFVSEGIAEIERTQNVKIAVDNERRILVSISAAAGKMYDDLPYAKIPMLSMLSDALSDAGYLKRKTTLE